MGIVLQNILTIVWFPGSKKRMQMHIAMSLIAGTTLSFGGKYGFILVTAGAHAVCIAVATLMYYERIKSFNLFNEENYNSFRPLIPDQVYSASEKSAINSQTRYRNAFYLSSDWRGYQKISESLTAEEISELIGNYYDDINQVLGEHLAGTDFFSDWIADELMVIIPTDSEEQKAEIASKIVSACQQIGKLLNTAARYEMLDIDIGVSFGKSVIGFIGPKQHRKMTALGRNPGHSRRLEGVGKALREEFSNTMYLITNDPQIVEALKADSLPVRSKSIAIKDLGQTEVSFVAVLDDQPAVTCTDGIAA
jgi:class 3 adenylate cyclase